MSQEGGKPVSLMTGELLALGFENVFNARAEAAVAETRPAEA
jgi:hypothetical protein